MDGLRVAVSSALDYGLAAVERGEELAQPPAELLAQARLAARSGVSLDTVLRRYLAGYTLLCHFMLEEAGATPEVGDYSRGELKRVLSSEAALFERLVATVSEEYVRETRARASSSEQRRTAWIERLLSGEPLDPSGFAYDFEGLHTGLVAAGHRGSDVLRQLAADVGRQLLLVKRGDMIAWAWLGGRRTLDTAELMDRATSLCEQPLTLAIGEPNEGMSGWRLSHRQAAAALSVALRRPEPVVRYMDVALLASVLSDDLLADSLRRLYLDPLERGRDEGRVAYETLLAYFTADRNVSSAAAALKVSRNTVASRLAAVERRLGRALDSCIAELEAALRLRELDEAPAHVAAWQSADLSPVS